MGSQNLPCVGIWHHKFELLKFIYEHKFTGEYDINIICIVDASKDDETSCEALLEGN